MNSKGQLVRYLRETGTLHSQSIEKALLAVDRKRFVPTGERAFAYLDQALATGHGQTISQPSTVVFMLELLAVQPGQRVLDIGYGSGWQTALLAHLVGERGQVFAIERLPELARWGEANVRQFPELAEQVTFRCGDGSDGWLEQVPFDRIAVAAAGDEAAAQRLKRQLATGGRLIMPVGAPTQDLVLIERSGVGQFRGQRFPGFVFVPLVSGAMEREI